MSTKTSNHLLKLPGAGKNGLAKGKKTRKDKEKKKPSQEMTLLPVRPKAMCISCYVNILTDKNSAKLYWKNSILNYEIEITALLSAFNLC